MKKILLFVLFIIYPHELLAEEILLEIDIPTKSLSSALEVVVWSEEKLAQRESNSKCVAAYDVATKKEILKCANGVEFKLVLPQKLTFPLQDKLILKSSELSIGKRFEISISAKSSDNCNIVTAIVSDIVTNQNMLIKELPWSSTLMNCVK